MGDRTVYLRKTRIRRYLEQDGLCYYCNKPMWESTIESDIFFLAKIGWKFNYNKTTKLPKINKVLTQRYRCTAEHLIRKVEGGKDKRINIVAACHACNSHRQEIPSNEYLIMRRNSVA